MMGPDHGVLLFSKASEIGRYDDYQRAAVRMSELYGLVRGRVLYSWASAIGKMLADLYFEDERHRQRNIMAAAIQDSLVRNPDALKALVEAMVPPNSEGQQND